MNLDFLDVLAKPMQKTMGTVGTPGTCGIHAGLSVPEAISGASSPVHSKRVQVYRWVSARCTRSIRAWGAEKFLYRDSTEWCEGSSQGPCCRRSFAMILDQSFERDADGCLAEAFMSIKGLGCKPTRMVQ